MADVAADLTNEHPPLRTDPWRIAWNILASDVLLVSALLALAFLMALAAWLPQAPDSMTAPVAFSRWLAETQVRFGNPFPLLRQIGLFGLERSPVLRALIALASLCLMVRLLESVRSAWRARRPRTLSAFGAPETVSELSLGEIATALRRQRFRVVRKGDSLYADRFPLADAGRITTYLGGLLIVAGLIITNAAGWRVDNLTVGVGQTIPVGHNTPYNLRLDTLDPARGGHIAFLREADVIGEGDLALERPVRLAGLAIFLNGQGPAIRASATFTDGQPLRLQTSAASTLSKELLLLLTRDDPDRFYAAPDADLVVRLSRGASYESIHAQVYRSRTGAVVFDGDIPPGGQVNAENVVFAFGVETYAVLDAVHDPGIAVTLAGMILLVLGLAVAVLWPVKRLTAVADSSGTRLIGDADQIQPIHPAAPRLTARERLMRLVAIVGWRLGLAVLSIMVGIVIVRSLMRVGLLWPTPSVAPAFLAAWLTGCAAVILPHRVAKWTTLVLAVVVLAVMMIWPGLVLPPGL